LANPEAQDIARKVMNALNGTKRSNGRDRIFHLELDAESIARSIIHMYHENVVH